MIKPCATCIVKACCSIPCKEYATYVYFEEFKKSDFSYLNFLKDYSPKKAIEYILEAEKIYFSLKNDLKNTERINLVTHIQRGQIS